MHHQLPFRKVAPKSDYLKKFISNRHIAWSSYISWKISTLSLGRGGGGGWVGGLCPSMWKWRGLSFRLYCSSSGTPRIFHEMIKSKKNQMFSRFDKASYFRRLEFSSTTLWEPQISHNTFRVYSSCLHYSQAAVRRFLLVKRSEMN
jgi:hypothetical protein